MRPMEKRTFDDGVGDGRDITAGGGPEERQRSRARTRRRAHKGSDDIPANDPIAVAYARSASPAKSRVSSCLGTRRP